MTRRTTGSLTAKVQKLAIRACDKAANKKRKAVQVADWTKGSVAEMMESRGRLNEATRELETMLKQVNG